MRPIAQHRTPFCCQYPIEKRLSRLATYETYKKRSKGTLHTFLMASIAFYFSDALSLPSPSLSKSLDITKSRLPTIPSPSRSKLMSGFRALRLLLYRSVKVRFGFTAGPFYHHSGTLISSFDTLRPAFIWSFMVVSLLRPLLSSLKGWCMLRSKLELMVLAPLLPTMLFEAASKGEAATVSDILFSFLTLRFLFLINYKL